jgi:hypothetical protein
MDEQRLLYLIEKIAHIGEKYGVASLKMDDYSRDHLRVEYDKTMDEIRRMLAPPQWGPSHAIQAGRMAGKTATAVKMQQAQMLQQMIYALGIDETAKEPEEEPPTVIEFSL